MKGVDVMGVDWRSRWMMGERGVELAVLVSRSTRRCVAVVDTG